MTVKELKRILNNVVSDLEFYEDDQEIKMVSNTYFLGNPKYFLGVAGYDGGYINFDNMVAEDEDDD